MYYNLPNLQERVVSHADLGCHTVYLEYPSDLALILWRSEGYIFNRFNLLTGFS